MRQNRPWPTLAFTHYCSEFMLGMRTCLPCHIPDRWSRNANRIWPDLAFGFVHKRSGNEINAICKQQFLDARSRARALDTHARARARVVCLHPVDWVTVKPLTKNDWFSSPVQTGNVGWSNTIKQWFSRLGTLFDRVSSSLNICRLDWDLRVLSVLLATACLNSLDFCK